jgi:hypothetical protein
MLFQNLSSMWIYAGYDLLCFLGNTHSARWVIAYLVVEVAIVVAARLKPPEETMSTPASSGPRNAVKRGALKAKAIGRGPSRGDETGSRDG